MRARAFLAFAGAALFGCGSDDESSGIGPHPVYPVVGCEHIEHRPCDIRDGPCQERLMKLAACLRGSDPLPVPPVTMMTPSEFVDFVNQDTSEEPPPDPNHYERALTLLDLVEPGALSQSEIVEEDIEFLWGIYRHDDKDIVIVDHGVSADETTPNAVMLHEFVHALQDHDVDLGRYIEEYALDYDSALAARSVVEGEARFHESRYFASLLGLDPAAVDWTSHFQETAEYGEEWILSQPSPYLASYSSFPYEFGARLVHHAWSEAGAAGVDALFASPPTRSQAIMESVDEVVLADWPAPEFPALDTPVPWTLAARTSLGAWGLFLRLALAIEVGTARFIALELVGDELEVYANEDLPTETAVVWRLEFSRENSAAAFESHERQRSSALVREGARVVFARSTGTSPLDWALVP
jgi:hypothetical protein